jgi:hypothetical protein
MLVLRIRYTSLLICLPFLNGARLLCNLRKRSQIDSVFSLSICLDPFKTFMESSLGLVELEGTLIKLISVMLLIYWDVLSLNLNILFLE